MPQLTILLDEAANLPHTTSQARIEMRAGATYEQRTLIDEINEQLKERPVPYVRIKRLLRLLRATHQAAA